MEIKNAKLFELEEQGRRFQVYVADDAAFTMIEWVPFMGGDAENGPETDYNPELISSGMGCAPTEAAVLDLVRERIAREDDGVPMDFQIGNTGVTVTEILARKEPRTKNWPESGELAMVLAVQNKQGKKTKLHFYQCWDKRSIDTEELRAEDPSIFGDTYFIPGDWYSRDKAFATYLSGSGEDWGKAIGGDWAGVPIEEEVKPKPDTHVAFFWVHDLYDRDGNEMKAHLFKVGKITGPGSDQPSPDGARTVPDYEVIWRRGQKEDREKIMTALGYDPDNGIPLNNDNPIVFGIPDREVELGGKTFGIEELINFHMGEQDPRSDEDLWMMTFRME